MASPVVKCVVNTCTHYLPGEYCGAENIDVLNEEPHNMAENSEHTECKTFYKRTGVTSMLGSMDNVNWSGMVTAPFEGGTQVTPTVTCVIDSCKYWDRGNYCGADEIEVSGMDADECQDTNCATFANRDR